MSLSDHKLVVWQRADDLFIDVHHLTMQHFPSTERYELGSQLRRSALFSARRILIATWRCSSWSRARYTSPIPPAPSRVTIS
jgi:hypothetical protein